MSVVKFSHFVDPCKFIWIFTWFRCQLCFKSSLKVHFISLVTIICDVAQMVIVHKYI